MARKALKDWTQADYNQFTPDEAMRYYNQKLAAGDKANANYWFNQWKYHYQNKENEETKKKQAKANDPARNMVYGAGGTVLAAGALKGGQMAADAIKTANTAKDVLNTTNAVNSISNAGQAANIGSESMSLADSGLGSLQYGGESLFGSGAGMAEGASTASEGANAAGNAAQASEGLSGLSSFALPTALLLASQLTDHYMDKQKQDTKNLNAFLNPWGTFRNTLEATPKMLSGDRLSPEEEWGLTGSAIGLAFPGFAPAYNALFASGSGKFGSSKGKDQLARDNLRGYLEKQGIIPDNDVIKFGDNSEFSMYYDGGARLDNYGKDDPRYDNNQRRYMDVDFTNPESEKSIQDIDPLALALLPEDVRLKSDLTGYLVNAVQTGDLANKGTRTQELYNRFGGYDSIKSAIEDRFKTGLITEEQKNSALASVDRVMGYKPTYSFGMGA